MESPHADDECTNVIALSPTFARPWSVTQVDVGVEQVTQTQVLSQRGGQDQASVSHQTLIIEGHTNGIKAVR